jgi:hypothetical protein
MLDTEGPSNSGPGALEEQTMRADIPCSVEATEIDLQACNCFVHQRHILGIGERKTGLEVDWGLVLVHRRGVGLIPF